MRSISSHLHSKKKEDEQWISKFYEITLASYEKKNQLPTRERLPVSQFLTVLFDIVEDWSRSRNPKCVNCIPFACICHNGTNWPKNVDSRLPVGADEEGVHRGATFIGNHYILRCCWEQKDNNSCVAAEIQEQKLQVEKFRRILHVSGENTSCSCPHFQRKGVCKHALGMLIRL